MGIKVSEPKAVKPTVAEMVLNALKFLDNRQGTSLAAIKKHMAGFYSVEPAKIAVHIKKFIKTAVEKGMVIQTKGKGASGSFKINKKVAEKTKIETGGKASRDRRKKPRTPARKALFQTPVPGRAKSKKRDLGALPIPPTPACITNNHPRQALNFEL